MALKDILAISGKPGLYRFISQGRSGIIVESLMDQKRTNATATAKISALEDIAIYTDEKEIPLADVMKKIREKENGEKTIDHKSSNDELKNLMEEIVPEYDKDRVYVSDMKKIVQWYNTLQEADMLDLLDKEEEEEKQESESESESEGSEEEK